MPWQLFGNGRSDWSTKLTRGLEAEAAAGFQSRRGRCREPTPVTPQYATFQTYKAAGVHHNHGRCGGDLADGRTRAAGRSATAYRRGHVAVFGRPRVSGLFDGVPSSSAGIWVDRWP